MSEPTFGGTHLPNVTEVLLVDSGVSLSSPGGVYIWANGDWITVYTEKDTHKGRIIPRKRIHEMVFGPRE